MSSNEPELTNEELIGGAAAQEAAEQGGGPGSNQGQGQGGGPEGNQGQGQGDGASPPETAAEEGSESDEITLTPPQPDFSEPEDPESVFFTEAQESPPAAESSFEIDETGPVETIQAGEATITFEAAGSEPSEEDPALIFDGAGSPGPSGESDGTAITFDGAGASNESEQPDDTIIDLGVDSAETAESIVVSEGDAFITFEDAATADSSEPGQIESTTVEDEAVIEDGSLEDLDGSAEEPAPAAAPGEAQTVVASSEEFEPIVNAGFVSRAEAAQDAGFGSGASLQGVANTDALARPSRAEAAASDTTAPTDADGADSGASAGSAGLEAFAVEVTAQVAVPAEPDAPAGRTIATDLDAAEIEIISDAVGDDAAEQEE